MFNWSGFLIYDLVTAGTPGPNNIMAMSSGGRIGFKKTLPFNFGVLVGFIIVSVLCTIFCAMLTALVPKIILPMKIIGAAYMLWLAWKTLRSSSEIEENHRELGFWSGTVLQFVNPKLYLCCIMSLEAYILPVYPDNYLIMFMFDIIMAISALLSTMAWSAFGSVFQKLFSKYSKITNTIMALLLVYCVVSLFV